MKRLISLLLVLAMTISLVPGVYAASGAVSSNIDEHWYINAQRWNDPSRSTLAAEEGGYLRVECIGENLVVERYDSSFQYLSGQTIPLELPRYGGVYICDDYNFVLVGQSNPDESDEVEVFRIIRYSKDWEKLDHASIYGANTTVPFDAGCPRFDRCGDILYIRTDHEMYTTEDGVNHQANVMIALRISDMTVTDQLTDVLNKNYGYVSHSFNQFVRVDGDTLLAVDHGDALPRSVCLFKYPYSASSETFFGRTTMVNVLPIVDSTYHYNDTGVSVGGFEFSSTDYLTAGSAYDMSVSTDLMYAHRNIFVTATPKDNFTDEGTTVHWLTDYSAEDAVEVSPPHLVKLDSDRFFLIWTENDELKYCLLDGLGQLVGQIYTGEGDLSDCVPILDGSRILWYVTDSSAPVFYEIDLSGPQFDPNVVAYGKAGDDIEWVLGTDGHLELTGSGDMYDFTSSTQPWDGYEDQILSVSFGEGITSLGNYSFFSCDNLSQVSLPSTMTRMGKEAFSYCESMTAITIPESVKELGNAVFFACGGLTEVIVPDSVTTMGRSVFRDCSGLKSVRLPAGLTAIGNYLFSNCEALESIDIPQGITSIGNYAFTGCSSLTSLTIPASVTSIGTAFYQCSSLEKFIVEPGSTAYRTDHQGALYTIDGITLISIPGGFQGAFTIPATVTTVAEYAGAWCANMTALSMPDSVTALGDAAFTHSGVKVATLSYNLTVLPRSCFSLCDSLESVTIPNSVTAIEDGAFNFCYALKQVEMPLRLEVLGDAFSFCTSLTAIVVPEGITALDTSTFSGCSALETVQLPSTLTSIGQHCFLDCTSLHQINLPEGLTTIGVGAFIRCEALADLTLPSTLTFLSRLAFYDSGLSTVTFTGPAPTFEDTTVFEDVTATVYYPMRDESWTEEVRQQYRGNLTWVAKDMHTHNWTAATCTTPQTCTICGGTQGEALGHQEVTDPGYAATCTESGLTDGSHCSRCNVTITAQVVIPALGHDYESVVTKPTCTDSGYTTHTCSRCADRYVDSYTAALGHSYGDWYRTTAPDCESEGAERRDCTRCEHFESRAVAALGHDYVAVVTAPTCTEQGCTTHTCSRCGDSYVDSYISATGHSWDEGTVIQEPTDTELGICRYTCLTCQAIEDRPYGCVHRYETTVTDPTCTEQGFTTYTCTDCGDSHIADYTAALGHDYVAVVTDPTCTEPGFTTHTCSRCADCYLDSPTVPLGHHWKGLDCTRCGAVRENPFSDTDPEGFYFEPVLWAVENGITTGTSADEFSPLASCNRAQVVTFLWRSAGCPEPKSGVNPFDDVTETDFYYDAVLWAVEKGITTGTSATEFSPLGVCNRAQVVTFLWRTAGRPEPKSGANPFGDVQKTDFYYDAVLWAVEKSITNGISATEFSPLGVCNRAQVVTFLYRTFA